MKKIEPMFKVKQAYDSKLIDDHIYNSIIKRKHIIEEGINKIQKLTEIEYPQYFIDPNLLIANSPLEYGQFSIIYARTIPISNKDNKIEVLIQLFTPLVIYGLKGTIYSVIAHEFLHYLNLLNKIINLEISSDTTNSTLFENVYNDNEKLFDYRKVFRKDRYLTKIINKKFENGFNDENLNKKSIKFWIEKKLPIETLSIESNYTRLSFLSMANTEIEEDIKKKLSKLL
jgi:hypothetical protein